MSVDIEQIHQEKLAYSYIRYSSKRQEFGDSFRRQTQQTKDFCEKYGYTLANQFEDLGVSGFKDDQEALQAFIRDCESGKIKKGSLLIVESLDRLSRKQTKIALRQMLQILEYVDVYSHHEQKFYRSEADNSDNQMIDLMMSIMVMSRAYNESFAKQKRLKEAWDAARNKAKKGIGKVKGSLPHWLSLSPDATKFIIKEDRTDIIFTMFELSASGMGSTQIIKFLNKNIDKYPSPSPKTKLWVRSTVKRILGDKRLLGEHQFFKADPTNVKKKIPAGDVIPDYFPQVIDEELFYEVQSGMRSRKIKAGRVSSTHFPNVFRHILKCGCCGASMSYVNKGLMNAKVRKPTKYLACSVAKRSDECSQSKHFRYEPIEHMLIHLATANGFMPKVESSADLTVRYEKLLATHEKEQKQLEMLLSRDLTSQIIMDKISALDKSVQRISSEIQALEDLIAANKGQYQYKDLYRDLVLLDDEIMKYSNRAQFNSHMQQEIDLAYLYHRYGQPHLVFKMKSGLVHAALLDQQGTFGGCSLEDGSDTFKRLEGKNSLEDDARLWKLLKYVGDISDDVENADLYAHHRSQIHDLMSKLSAKLSKYVQKPTDESLFEEIYELSDRVYAEIGKNEKVFIE
ncbi:TPA: recombinase family protein [Vibrio parahaemolyticus]|uniref:recombinase family protein n=1 Tax=Vibrio TaxID=662 RepID=UPI00111DB131|nr:MULTISPECIES: recombinase family protein [Vibrio]TOD48359.1 recombinase family protein [Vibrio parahaemolyticus]WHR51519.1 recombinase family protein [Vibrio furnissii]HCG6381779.1 recombinase family protein [Vibrio parahaemolyticus]